jgi:hypothetical protein
LVFTIIIGGVILFYQSSCLPEMEIKTPEIKTLRENTQPKTNTHKLSGKILIYTGHPNSVYPIFAYIIDTREKQKLFDIKITETVAWGRGSVILFPGNTALYQNNLVVMDSLKTLTLYDLLSGEKSTLFTAKEMISEPIV